MQVAGVRVCLSVVRELLNYDKVFSLPSRVPRFTSEEGKRELNELRTREFDKMGITPPL